MNRHTENKFRGNMLPLDDYFTEIKKTIDLMSVVTIEKVVSILQEARLNGRQVFIMGNGGSASTASHFVCDLAKRTRLPGWPNFRVIGLTDNMAILSAYANDEGYETVFAEQLNNLIHPLDVVIGISCSGNSQNVLNGIDLANTRGAKTIAFTALDGGKLRQMAQVCIHVPTDRVDQGEDIHLMLEHMITEALARQAEFIQPYGMADIARTRFEEYGESLVKQLFGQSLSLADDSLASVDGSASPEILSNISQEFATKLDLHKLLMRILNLTVNYVGASSGSIVVLDDRGEVIDGASAYAGKIEERPVEHFAETVQKGLAGWVVENRRPAIVENTEEDPRWLKRIWETSRSAISIPLMTMDRVIGVLTLTRMQTQQFNMEDLSLLTAVTLTLSYSFGLNQATRR
jgi:D-sedoheptulose 7-phosphate isomerase